MKRTVNVPGLPMRVELAQVPLATVKPLSSAKVTLSNISEFVEDAARSFLK